MSERAVAAATRNGLPFVNSYQDKFDSLLKGMEPVGQQIFSRANEHLVSMRHTPSVPMSWLGKLRIVSDLLVHLFADSMGKDLNAVKPGWWLRTVRSTMDNFAPWLVPKPSGVISESFSYEPQKAKEENIPYINLAQVQHKQPDGITGEWVRPAHYDLDRPNSERKVVIYLPGGAYHLGSRYTHGSMSGRIAREVHCEVCVLDYSLLPEHPYPAAMNDVITLYNHLLQQGYRPENIIFSGDSAGGHLALAAVHHIQACIYQGKKHQQKVSSESGLACAALALISPTVDFHMQHLDYEGKEDPIMPAKVIPHVGRSLSRHLSSSSSLKSEEVLEDPAISPGFVKLDELGGMHAPVLASYGSDEVLGIGAGHFVRKLAEQGIPAGQHQGEIFHAAHLFHSYFPEADAMMIEVTDFIEHMLQTRDHRVADAAKAINKGHMDLDGFPL